MPTPSLSGVCLRFPLPSPLLSLSLPASVSPLLTLWGCWPFPRRDCPRGLTGPMVRVQDLCSLLPLLPSLWPHLCTQWKTPPLPPQPFSSAVGLLGLPPAGKSVRLSAPPFCHSAGSVDIDLGTLVLLSKSVTSVHMRIAVSAHKGRSPEPRQCSTRGSKERMGVPLRELGSGPWGIPWVGSRRRWRQLTWLPSPSTPGGLTWQVVFTPWGETPACLPAGLKLTQTQTPLSPHTSPGHPLGCRSVSSDGLWAEVAAFKTVPEGGDLFS